MSLDTQVLPLPSLEPRLYNQGDFVNREYELRQIRRKVNEGLAGYPITQPVIHLWGLRGVGKSWLLRRLETDYRFAPDKRNGKEGTFSLLADFHAVELRFSTWEPIRVTRLLGRLVEQVEKQLGERLYDAARDELTAFKAEFQRLTESDGTREAADLVDWFVALIVRLSRRFVPLLLLDTVEKLDEDSFFWLESHVIEPIVRTNGVIVIVAGRKEIPRWREFGVRQRLVVWEITSFNKEGTTEQLARRGYGHLGDLVYSLSSGHPYINQFLGEALDRLTNRQPPPPDFVEAHRAEVVALLGALETEFLREVDSEVHRNVLRILSTLRKFNIELARHMLGKLLDDSYERQPDSYFLRLFEDLEDTNLVWWSADQRGYVIGPELRRLMALRAQKGSMEAFIERHKEALKKYQEIVRRPSSLDHVGFLTETLFHLANTLLGQELSIAEKEIKAFLDEVLVPDKLTTDGADALFQLIYRDQELQDPRGVMSGAIYDQVIQRIRRFRDQRAESEPVEDTQDEP